MTTTLTRDQVTITRCTCGRLVRLTHRWERSCSGCGQSIETGAIGPYTWDDCRSDGSGSHDIGKWSHQHGCGTWNSPTEVTEYLDDTVDGDLDAAVEAGLEELSEAVEKEKDAERARIRGDLYELRDRALAHVRSHPGHPDQSCDDPNCPLTGGELTPGVFVEHTDPWGHHAARDELVAWEWDPTSDEGDTIEVSIDVTGLVRAGVFQ